MSSTRLLVLGVVRIFQPVHGYMVRRELLTWKADEWAHINPGSIYNALRTLTKDGFVEETGSFAHGYRPARTTYRLTLDGENEFFELLRHALWNVDGHDPAQLLAALSFMGNLHRDEVIDALEARSGRLEDEARALEHAVRHVHEARTVPAHVAEHFGLGIARLNAERDFCRGLAGRLRKGFYRFNPEPGFDNGPGPQGWPGPLDEP